MGVALMSLIIPMARNKMISMPRINLRMAIFAIVILALIGYPVYVFLTAAITGGISRRGDLLVVDLKAMSDFDLDQINATSDAIPSRFRDLDGKRVIVTGEMWAPDIA